MKSKKNALTEQQEQFAADYARTLNATQSFKNISGSDIKTSTAEKNGLNMLKESCVKSRVNELIAIRKKATNKQIKKIFSADANDILCGIYEIAKSAVNDRDRLRAYELLGKHFGAFIDRTEINVSGSLSISHVKLEVPNNNRAAIEIIDGDIIE